MVSSLIIKLEEVKSMLVGNEEITITGKFIKTARMNEEWYKDVEHPDAFLRALRVYGVKVDIFTFWQRLPDTEPKHDYYMEPEYIAAIRVVSFEHWWHKQIKARTRNLIRKAEKKGVVVREAEFNDKFVRGMESIFNEVPIRQGKPFWHYGKDFETVKREFSRYLFREELIGAYYNDELIGFSMLSYTGKYALTGQIISKIAHRNKAPNNALIAKAVEICHRKKIPYLVYLNWARGSLAEFKRRNGFEKISLPRYYIPLTMKGGIALKLHLHLGFAGIVPDRWKDILIHLRKKWYSRKYARTKLNLDDLVKKSPLF